MNFDSQKNKCILCGKSEHDIIGKGTDYQYSNTDEFFFWCKCKNCNHHYINPLPSEKYLLNLYKGIGNYEKFETNPGLAFKVKKYLDRVSFKKFSRPFEKNLRFLDVGCAPGSMLDLVSKNFPEFEILEGIEISEEAAKLSKKKGYKVHVGTAETINLNNNFYDLIFMQQVIEHLVDPNKVIKNLYNSLRSGGLLVLETPGLNTWDYKIFKSGTWEGFHIPRHLNLWTTEGMYKMLKTSGFNNIRHSYKLRPVHWTVSIQNFLKKNKKFYFIQKRLDMNVKFPIEIIFFTIVEIIQKFITGKTSDVQYIAKK
jgi:SAM-dependent methyltransferase